MNHLPLPAGVEPYIVVPYAAPRSEYYDGKDFFGYPKRCGWNKKDLMGENSFGNRTKEQVERFFQTWLFFGMAIEVFKSLNITVNTEDFLCSNEYPDPEPGSPQKRIVTTAKLPSLLLEWKKHWLLPEDVSPDCSCKYSIEPRKHHCTAKPCWKNMNPGRISDAWATMQSILDRAKVFVNCYCTIVPKSKSEEYEGVSNHAWPVRDEIATSIMALGYSLRRSALDINGIVGMPDQWSTGTSATLKGLLEEKWCCSNATMMIVDFDVDGQYYLAATDGPGDEYLKFHASCSSERCVAKVDEISYVTKHAPDCVDDECKTAFAKEGTNSLLDEVVKILDRDGTPGNPVTPLILWNDDKHTAAVTEYNPKEGLNPQYVAISHVWSDGMGNPRENRLPSCQLARIQHMVNSLDLPDRDPSSPVAFWMDTLCIPVADKYKPLRKECIRSMRLIYQEATAVLVLDAWMQQVPLAAPAPVRSTHLYTSNWLRRLWTFQEGILNRKVYLRFRDSAQDFDRLLDDVHAWEASLRTTLGTHVHFPSLAVTKSSLYFNVIADMVQVVANGKENASDLQILYVPLFDCLGHRVTTRDLDETLCLSSILGMDPKPFNDIDLPPGTKLDAQGRVDPAAVEDVVQRRMEAFLYALGEFNNGLLFCHYPRLSRDGVRWAPRSLMGHRTANLAQALHPDTETVSMRHVGAHYGLAMQFAGFFLPGGALQEGPGAGRFVVVFRPKHHRSGGEESARPAKRHYVVEMKSQEAQDMIRETAGGRYGIILAEKPRDSRAKIAGMIGEVVSEEEQYPIVRFKCCLTAEKRRGKDPENSLEVDLKSSSSKWLVI